MCETFQDSEAFNFPHCHQSEWLNKEKYLNRNYEMFSSVHFGLSAFNIWNTDAIF